MVFTHQSLLNINERVLIYLLNNPYQLELPDASEDLTAFGIAGAIASDRNNIYYNLKELINNHHIIENIKHIKGKKKKQKIYVLTDSGRNESKIIRDKLFSKEIIISNQDNKLSRIKFPEVSKYLESLNICNELNELEICRYTNFKGILDTSLLKDNDSIVFPSNINKPEVFYGREIELNQLKIWIDNKTNFNYIIIYGMAGIGKTTLVSKFIEKYKDKIHIFWHRLNEWDTPIDVIIKVFEFILKVNKNNFSTYLEQNKLKDNKKTLELLKQNLDEINAILIYDDFHKINNELQDFFALLINTFGQHIKNKFIFLTRYKIPFYDQQDVLSKKSVIEFELTGLNFENSVKIMQRKGISKRDYKTIYEITAGIPLLLEIIDSKNKTQRYIYEELFSKLSKNEKIIMESLSTFRDPIPYDALFINNKIPPETIDNLIQKSIIKLNPDGLYYTHEYIKDYFYKRLNPHIKSEYHGHCAEFMINNNDFDPVEIFYHQLKAHKFEKAIDTAFSRAQDIINQGYSAKFLVALEEFPKIEISIDSLAEFQILKAKLNFILGNWDKSLEYYNKAIEVSIQSGNEITKARGYCKIGHIYEEKNLFDEALKNFKKSLEISKEIKDLKFIAESKRGIGRYYWRKGNYIDAEKYYNESLKVLKYTDYSNLIGIINIDIGNIYFENGNYDQAIISLQNALNYLEKVGDNLEIARAYNSLGSAYTYKGNFDEAISCFKKQLEIVETIGDVKLYGYGLSNLGYCYAKYNQITQAEDYIKKAHEIFEKTNNENILFTIYRTLGLISQHRKNWKNAISYFDKSLKIIRKLKIPLYIALTIFELGLIHEDKKDFKSAKKCFIEAYSIHNKMNRQIPSDLKEKLMTYKLVS